MGWVVKLESSIQQSRPFLRQDEESFTEIRRESTVSTWKLNMLALILSFGGDPKTAPLAALGISLYAALIMGLLGSISGTICIVKSQSFPLAAGLSLLLVFRLPMLIFSLLVDFYLRSVFAKSLVEVFGDRALPKLTGLILHTIPIGAVSFISVGCITMIAIMSRQNSTISGRQRWIIVAVCIWETVVLAFYPLLLSWLYFK